MVDERIIAYTAGFFDGEGSLGNYGKGRFSVRIAQGEANNGAAILGELRQQWNGIGSIHCYRKRKESQQWFCYEWAIGGAWQVRTFLTDVIPHLRIKQAKARQLLAEVELHLATRRHVFTPEQDSVLLARWNDRTVTLRNLARIVRHSETGTRKRARALGLTERRKRAL